MGSNSLEFKIVVNEQGMVTGIKSVRALGDEVQRTTDKKRQASKASDELAYKLNQGVTGSSSAARSFSKLNQTIGNGPNGLVGAYATLAANIFAVSSAFNALREAAQVEQTLKGLEFQGARTGKTLTLAAQQLREVTQYAISTADSLRSTALVTSGGFGAKEVKELGQVAMNASLALGRNLPDALDRITKGVVKLEPELLDELGIMTKLTEATNTYALAHNKSANSLTSFEKRQAFLNAVLAEGQLKFNGISQEVGANPYDKLVATFKDLTNDVLSVANAIGSVVAKLAAMNEGILGGALLLFGSAISRQLVPALYQMSSQAQKSRDALMEQAKAQRVAAEEALKAAKANKEAELSGLRNIKVIDQYPAKFKQAAAAIREGALAAPEMTKEINRLNAAIRARETQLTNIYAGTAQEGEKRAIIESLKQTRDQLISLRQAEIDYKNSVITSTEASRKARTTEYALIRQARAEDLRAVAIEQASKGKLMASWTALTASVKEYAIAVALARKAESGGAPVGRAAKAMDSLKVASFAAGTAIRGVAAGFMAAIPYIGAATLAISLLYEAYKFFSETEQDRAKKKALEDLGTVLDSTTDKIKQLAKTQATLASYSAVSTQYLAAQANTVTELADATINALSEIEKQTAAEGNGSGVSGFWKALFGDSKDVASYATGIAKDSKFLDVLAAEFDKQEQAITQSGSSSIGTRLANMFFGANDETTKRLTALSQMDKVVGQDLTKSLYAAYGGASKLAASPALTKDYMNKIKLIYIDVANNVKQLEESYKQAEVAATEFWRAGVESTRYDNVLKQFESINDAVNNLKKNVTISTVDFAGVLSGIGPETAKFLNAQQQGLVTDLQKNFAVYQNLNAKKEQGLIYDQKAYDIAKRNLETKASEIPLLIRNLRAVEDNLIISQQIERSYKSQIGVIQAIMGANQAAYAAGAAGYRARIAREEQVRNLQVAQLNAQIQYNKTSIATAEAMLAQLELKKKLNEEEAYGAFIAATKLRTEAEAAAGLAGLTAQEIANSDSTRNNLNDAQQAALTQLKTSKLAVETAKEQVDVNDQIRAADRSIRDSKSVISSLQANINQLNLANLTTEQKIAQAAEAELLFRQQIVDANKKNEASLITLERSQKKLLDTLSGAAKSPLYQINDIMEEADATRKDITNSAERDISALNASIAVTTANLNAARQKGQKEEAAAYASNLSAQQGLLKARELERDIALEQLDVSTRQKVLDLAIIEARTEGLEIQKKGLDAMNAYSDALKKALDSEKELVTLRAQVAASKFGGELSERAQKAIEMKAAKDQYELAKQQFALKKLGIELEYDLLEAQRLLLVEELKAKKQLLGIEANKQRAAGNIREADNLDLIVGQMSATIENITQRSFNDIKGLALQDARRQLDILEQQAELAKNNYINAGRSVTQTDKVLSTFASATTLLDRVTSNPALNKDNKPELNDPVVVSNNSLTEAINTNFTPLTQSIDGLRKRLEDNRAAEISNVVSKTITATLSRPSGPLTSLFGMRTNPATGKRAMHEGIDIGLPYGSDVRGTVGGRVKYAGPMGGYGNVVDIETTLANGDKLLTRYAHLSRILVQTGDQLEKDGLLGKVGSTGRSTGPHLHYEVQLNGKPIDPTKPIPLNIQTSVFAPTSQSANTAVASTTGSASTASASSEAVDPNEIVVTATRASEGHTKAAETVKLSWIDAWRTIYEASTPFLESLKALGPQGEVVVAVMGGFNTMSESIYAFMSTMEAGKLQLSDYTQLASSALATISSVTAAASTARIANIEKEIAAEQKRDGKSAESIAKIDAMEKKKDQIARKQFNINKKLSMAQAVLATATGIAEALKWGFPLGPIAAGVIGALGAAQIAVIAGTSYESSYTPQAVNAGPTSLSIGKRSDMVDLAKGPNANAGGEVGYLRGTSGYGSNASDYRTIGSAYGGSLFRGYGNRGFVVGEKGPEVISPETPVTVTPADKTSNASPIEANINIHAIDASGVHDMLIGQKGNIIKMLRDAANASGQRFMEDVNVNVYTRPNIGKL